MRTVLVRVQPPQPNFPAPKRSASLQIGRIVNSVKRQNRTAPARRMAVFLEFPWIFSRSSGGLLYRAVSKVSVNLQNVPARTSADRYGPLGVVFGVGGGSRSEGRSCRPSPQSPKGILGASSLLRFLLFARGWPNTRH